MELNTYFDGLLSNIEPNAENVKIAKKAHEKLRKSLEDDEDVSNAKPETYLSGSYARDTAINDIKDVDIILLIDLDHQKVTPNVVVTWLEGVLLKYYSSVTRQDRSVGVTTDNDFCLDVVPAVPISHRDGPVWIPDREVKNWVSSHPKGQIMFSTQRNNGTGGRYKPLVKIMKFWRDRLANEQAKAKSYILESLVAESLLSEPPSYGQAVADIFNSIYQKYSLYLTSRSVPTISDPGYPLVNVAKRWTFEEFSSFLNEIKSSRAVAKAALDSSDENESVKLWRKLFGLKFKPLEE